MKALAAFAAVLLVAPAMAAPKEDKKKEKVSIDDILFSETLWDKPLSELKGPDPEPDKNDEKLKEELKKKGIYVGKDAPEGFAWLSSAKDGLRANPKEFKLLGQEVGEVILRGRDGKPIDATVSIFNRGDDGEIPFATFNNKMTEWKGLIDGKMAGVRSETRNTQQGAVPIQGWTWKKGDTAIALEGSINKGEKRAEFIRLRLVSVSAAATAPAKMARRGTFAENVKKDDKGFTWIDGIPMVDQGQKGYCVVASIERVARYFGSTMDQHEMAQLANTGENGTSGDEMEKAFQRVTGKVHLRTLKLIDYDDKQAERDLRAYNSAAKKAGVKTFDIDTKNYYVDPRNFWFNADKGTFRDVKRAQPGYAQFSRKIKEYVDQGNPLCWTLYLGMFKEGDLPQSYGGHMRLIFGYNPTTEEIYYTDSWGEGHEKKKMRMDEAYCMTMALYAMIPNQ
ncbi:C39 family peptidase [Haloferula sp. BvORR071]|uniref:C39 family peptidase n=1 Tax=Haloferula sp. BvORR071 TaxID=1396141 RepID=UPI000556F545|nr:C39 family peptidase [Haloferula sp. BvORR071]